MRTSRFSEEQIVSILHEHAAGEATDGLCRCHRISAQTLYSWKLKYNGWERNELKRLKALEAENAWLKWLVAEQTLLRKKMMRPAQRRAAMIFVQDHLSVSQRRACRPVGCACATVRYHSRRGADDAIRGRLRELATQCPRFGYRRLHILIQQEGIAVNHKRIA